VVWSPLEHLALSLTYSYDHTEILSDCTVVGGQNQGTCFLDALDPEALAPGAKPVGAHEAPPNGLFAFSQAQSVKGDELPQAPANKISFNALYTWVFDPGNFSLSGTFVWKDKSFASVFERSYYEAPSWDQVDLRAVWSGDHDHY
jgi:iron complex outermembrane receptor protein